MPSAPPGESETLPGRQHLWMTWSPVRRATQTAALRAAGSGQRTAALRPADTTAGTTAALQTAGSGHDSRHDIGERAADRDSGQQHCGPADGKAAAAVAAAAPAVAAATGGGATTHRPLLIASRKRASAGLPPAAENARYAPDTLQIYGERASGWDRSRIVVRGRGVLSSIQHGWEID